MQTTLQLADSRLDNPANHGVSDLDCCAEICGTACGGVPAAARALAAALVRVAGVVASPAAPAPARKWRLLGPNRDSPCISATTVHPGLSRARYRGY